ncbi:VOC family protein [Pseudonocardia sp.]|uniref:VOC family protein n=1 Tax=Pseudonocardia sp. TaxID=60912 RepID=UPI003D0D0580
MNDSTTEAVETRRSPFDAPPAPTVWPTIGFTDLDAGVRLLTEGFGFVVTILVRDGGRVVHAEARWPDGGGVMFGSRGDHSEWGALGPQGAYVVAAEAATVDAAYERVRVLPGVTVTTPPEDTDYGSHQFGVRDADGNLWTMGTYPGAV